MPVAMLGSDVTRYFSPVFGVTHSVGFILFYGHRPATTQGQVAPENQANEHFIMNISYKFSEDSWEAVFIKTR
jgi:hypothetical protein